MSKTKSKKPTSIIVPGEEVGHWHVYEDNQRTFRNWIVAYGAGFLAIILSKGNISTTISSNGFSTIAMIICFLLAIFIFAILSFLNMWAGWFKYVKSLAPEDDNEIFLFSMKVPLGDNSLLVRFFRWYYTQIGLDILFQVLSIILLLSGTILAFFVYK
jgi:hypothetical protein